MRREDVPYGALKAYDAMSEYERELLGLPSHKSDRCLVCGKPAHDHHHVIPKRMGGRNREIEKLIPTVTLCGFGNTSGCHGLAHEGRIEFSYEEGEWHGILR